MKNEKKKEKKNGGGQAEMFSGGQAEYVFSCIDADRIDQMFSFGSGGLVRASDCASLAASSAAGDADGFTASG